MSVNNNRRIMILLNFLYMPPGLKLKIPIFGPHSVYVFCMDLRKKQRVFPYAKLTGWFLLLRQTVFTARYELGL
jgi:hypothetical protein